MRIALATLVLCGAASAQELSWSDTIEKAKESGKPIAYLRLLGELDGKL
jgi:hypothetical protein